MSGNQLKYTSRDYNSIKADLLEAINSVTSNWTSREESDPGIILLNLMSYLGDNLSFNLDMQAQEMYFPTATQRKNMKKLLALMGYKLHWYRSGIVQVTIGNNSDTPIILNTNIVSTGANNRLVTTVGNINYVIVPKSANYNENVITISGHENKSFTAVQGTVSFVDVKPDDINNNRFYIPVNNVDEAHLYLYFVTMPENSNDIDTQTDYTLWTLVDDINLHSSTGRYFEFDTDDYDRPYIQLPSKWQINAPAENGSLFKLYYIISNGSNGNVTDNAFFTVYNTPTTAGGEVSDASLTITNKTNWNTNDDDNCPGYNPQTAEEARNDAKNYINTYDTLVTISDFEKFIDRQVGFNAVTAIDVQRAEDLNNEIFNNYPPDASNLEHDKEMNETRIKKYVCKEGKLPAYTSNDSDVNSYIYKTITESDLSNYVINTIPSSILNETSLGADGKRSYILNVYCIYDNYNTEFLGLANPDEWNSPVNTAVTDSGSFGIPLYPYRRYVISDAVINGTGSEIEYGLNEKLENTKIMNVSVNYATCRVFDWRAVGTIYLRTPVIEDEADTIIDNVIKALEAKFTPDYVGFGNKISYMDVIETIQNADSRIRYFDAGRGDKKLVDWSKESFDMDYFNPISIMRFNQYSVPNEFSQNNSSLIPRYNMDEQFNKLLVVDSSSIKDY